MILLCLYSFVSIFVICSTLNDNGRFECDGPLPYVKEDDLPEFEPSKYTAADPTTFKPFKIHFVIPPDISNAMRQAVNKAADFVNDKLSATLKAPPVAQILRARQWNGTLEKCNPAKCFLARVPGKYALPCQHPETGDLIKEENVPFPVAKEVDILNERNDITLVVYVAAESHSPEHVEFCGERRTVLAYGFMCQVDPITLRPTHGVLGLCTNPDMVLGERGRRLVLHELMHILTAHNVIGLRSPAFDCAIGDDSRQCENITYKKVQREWMEKDGKMVNKSMLLVTMPNVKRAAQEYFGCASLEGPVTNTHMKTKVYPNGTVASFPLPGHWNQRLFPDELLSPWFYGTKRFSALTLGLLKDLGWYEVNMSAAEPMETTRPQKNGCDVADKSCHEIIKVARAQKPGGGVIRDIAPYCDVQYDYRTLLTISPLCSPDAREPRQCFEMTDTSKCPSLQHKDSDAYYCAEMTTQGSSTASRLGGTVGPGTICLTVAEIMMPVRIYHMAVSIGLCVGYRCDYNTTTLTAILRPSKNETCEIHCPAANSNELHRVNFTSGSYCQMKLDESMLVICPDFDTHCPSEPFETTFNLTPITGPGVILRDPIAVVPSNPQSGGHSWKYDGLVMVVIGISVIANTW